MFKKTMVLFLVCGIMLASLPAWAAEGGMHVNTIDIGKMTCKELMSGNDLDREIGIAFFHGYLAGRSNNQIVNLPTLSALSTDVRDFCLSNPNSTVMEAFLKAGK